ncbi:Cytochrome bo(3) ubiquinol oxidase subunit 4 [compost metagenome]
MVPAVRLYVAGFVLAVVLTLAAYVVVMEQLFEQYVAVYILVGLALVQFAVQLVFFLHLGQERKPRWNMAVFFFTLLVLVVIVLGSLWIMYNLNYSMNMTPAQMDEFMIKQSDKGF